MDLKTWRRSAPEAFDLHEVFEETLREKVNEITRLCETAGIPFCLAFGVAQDSLGVDVTVVEFSEVRAEVMPEKVLLAQVAVNEPPENFLTAAHAGHARRAWRVGLEAGELLDVPPISPDRPN